MFFPIPRLKRSNYRHKFTEDFQLGLNKKPIRQRHNATKAVSGQTAAENTLPITDNALRELTLYCKLNVAAAAG